MLYTRCRRWVQSPGSQVEALILHIPCSRTYSPPLSWKSSLATYKFKILIEHLQLTYGANHTILHSDIKASSEIRMAPYRVPNQISAVTALKIGWKSFNVSQNFQRISQNFQRISQNFQRISQKAARCNRLHVHFNIYFKNKYQVAYFPG